MDREIKFRGRDIKTGEWIYGFYIHGRVGFGSEHAMHEIYRVNPCGIYGTEIDPDTLGQYTGQRDLNTLEIYEGDICDDSGYVGVITFGEINCDTGQDQSNSCYDISYTYLGWHFVSTKRSLERSPYQSGASTDLCLDDYVVIGNIHEKEHTILSYEKREAEG